MTPEAQRIAIAEACGWKKVKSSQGSPWGISAAFPEYEYIHQLPNYLNCLNAMHEAEKMLTDEQQWDYFIAISKIVRPERFTDDDWFVGHTDWYHNILTSTASQRAKAFLKTIGKWTEGE